MEPHEVIWSLICVVWHFKKTIFFLGILLVRFFDCLGRQPSIEDQLRVPGADFRPGSLNISLRVGVILWAFFVRTRLAKHLIKALIQAFVGGVAWPWRNNNNTSSRLCTSSRLDCAVSFSIPPGISRCRGLEELSGKQLGGHHHHDDDDDDDDWAGFGSPIKRPCRQLLINSGIILPSTPEEIKNKWKETFELNCSELGQLRSPVIKLSTSWRRYLQPLKQHVNDTCTLMASTVAIEGMHRKVYETFHGPNKFPDAWKAANGWNAHLLRTCKVLKIWIKDKGAVVCKVLHHIQHNLGGVKTASGEGYQTEMRLASFKKHSDSELTKECVAGLLDQGPCVVTLFACPWFSCFNATKNNWVYRGTGRDPAKREACEREYPKKKHNIGSHAVVAFRYRVLENGEMHICILDNHTNDGPERWVDFRELDAVYSIQVNCLCDYAANHSRDDAAGASGTS